MSVWTKDDGRKHGREDGVRNLIEHEQKHNRHISEDKAREYINQRADVQDKRRDWAETGIKK